MENGVKGVRCAECGKDRHLGEFARSQRGEQMPICIYCMPRSRNNRPKADIARFPYNPPRKCPKCGTSDPTRFTLSARQKGGYCKKCQREYYQAYNGGGKLAQSQKKDTVKMCIVCEKEPRPADGGKMCPQCKKDFDATPEFKG